MVCTSSEDGKNYIVGIHKGCFTESIASRICFFQSIGNYVKWIETSLNLLEIRNEERKVYFPFFKPIKETLIITFFLRFYGTILKQVC